MMQMQHSIMHHVWCSLTTTTNNKFGLP